MEQSRCNWCLKDDLYIRYHDEEWGVPVWDDHRMFEFLTLETFQAGLSWYTVLSKRENFRKAFHQFDAQKMARMQENEILQLLQDPGIIRNQAKIRAAVNNAQLFCEISDGNRNFCELLWKYTGGKTRVNQNREMKDYQSTTAESDAMSKDLKKMGFKFVGSTVCYAHMQATGIVNDHLTSCFRFGEVNGL